jgi:hypothetical protein
MWSFTLFIVIFDNAVKELFIGRRLDHHPLLKETKSGQFDPFKPSYELVIVY